MDRISRDGWHVVKGLSVDEIALAGPSNDMDIFRVGKKFVPMAATTTGILAETADLDGDCLEVVVDDVVIRTTGD